jgi:hypothetical protein
MISKVIFLMPIFASVSAHIAEATRCEFSGVRSGAFLRLSIALVGA